MSFETQQRIRESALEAMESLHDLEQWQNDVKAQDRQLKQRKAAQSFSPPRQMPVAPDVDERASVKKSPIQKAEALRLEGNASFKCGDYGQAVAFYTESLRLQQTCVRCLY